MTPDANSQPVNANPIHTVVYAAVHLAILGLPTWCAISLQSIQFRVVEVVFLLGVVVAGVLESSYQSGDDISHSSLLGDRYETVVAHVVGIGLLICFWLAQFESHWRSTTSSFHGIALIGMAIFSTGVALRITAVKTLGEQFTSDIRTSGPRIETGIYAWFRHPSEIGLLAIAAGAPLLLNAWFTSILALAVLAPMSIWRMRREDRAWRDAGLKTLSPPALHLIETNGVGR